MTDILNSHNLQFMIHFKKQNMRQCNLHAHCFLNNTRLPTVNAAQVGVWRQIAVQSLVIPVPGCVRMPCVVPNTNFTPDVFSYVSVPPKHWPNNEHVSHM
jgi:hypothetical protein